MRRLLASLLLLAGLLQPVAATAPPPPTAPTERTNPSDREYVDGVSRSCRVGRHSWLSETSKSFHR
jgi:hypothetical protein